MPLSLSKSRSWSNQVSKSVYVSHGCVLSLRGCTTLLGNTHAALYGIASIAPVAGVARLYVQCCYTPAGKSLLQRQGDVAAARIVTHAHGALVDRLFA